MPEAMDSFGFVLQHPNPDWWRDNASYTFPDYVDDALMIRAWKAVPNRLIVHLLGPLNRWFILNGELRNCPKGVANVQISWSAQLVALKINGEIAAQGSPEAFVSTPNPGVAALVKTLGEEWVTAQLEQGDQTREHPFIEFYRRYLAMSERDRPTSIEAIPASILGNAISVAASCEGFSGILARLRHPKTFRDTASECLASELLLTIGGKVAFRQESKEPGVRTPDLCWLPGAGEIAIPVEAKRVHSYNSKRLDAGKQSRTIVKRVRKALNSANLLLNVYVLFKDIPTENAIKEALQALRDETALAYWRCLKSTDLVDVWAVEAVEGDFSEYNIELPSCAILDRCGISVESTASDSNLELVYPAMGAPGPGRALIRSRTPGGVLRDPRFISLDLDSVRMRVNNLVTLFKGAIQQLPPDGPGFVVVEIPHPTPGDLAKYVSWLEGEFAKGKFARVNLVYLIWIDANRETYRVGEQHFINAAGRVMLEMVPNPGCKVQIAIAHAHIPRIVVPQPDEAIIGIAGADGAKPSTAY